MRQTYAGGITQVTRHCVDEIAYSFDINSSYPAAMTMSMPWFFLRDMSTYEIETKLKDPDQIDLLEFYVLDSF